MSSIGPINNQPNQFSQNQGPAGDLSNVKARLAALRIESETNVDVQGSLSDLRSSMNDYRHSGKFEAADEIARNNDLINLLNGEIDYYSGSHPNINQQTATTVIEALKQSVVAMQKANEILERN